MATAKSVSNIVESSRHRGLSREALIGAYRNMRMSRRLDDLQCMLLMEKNRLGASRQLAPVVRDSVEKVIELLKAHKKGLMQQLFPVFDEVQG